MIQAIEPTQIITIVELGTAVYTPCLGITIEALKKFGHASAPKMDIQLILETVSTWNNISVNVVINVLDYGDSGCVVGKRLLIMFDDQKRVGVISPPPPLSKLNRGCVHMWCKRDRVLR